MLPSQITEITKKIPNSDLKIAVAIEGGGLRGLVSATMLEVLNDLSLNHNIKFLSGTSSGAINGSYFLANQLGELFILYKKMASKKFIQPLKFPDAMNLDYLFCEQIPQHFPLNFFQVKSQSKNYYVTITPVETGKTEFRDGTQLESQNDFLKLLRASSSAPLYTTNKEKIENKLFNDGHIGMAIPYHPLLDLDVDYILCLMTQPKAYRKKQSSFGRFHQWLALRGYSKEYQKSFSNSFRLYNEQLDFINIHPKLIPIQIESQDFLISKMCTDPNEVDRCRDSVRKRVLSIFT